MNGSNKKIKWDSYSNSFVFQSSLTTSEVCAYIQTRDIDYSTVLASVVVHGTIELFKILLDAKNIDVNWGDVPPIVYTTLYNRVKMCKLLLECDGINIHARNRSVGRTPIAIAINRNYLDIAKLLLSHGAEPPVYMPEITLEMGEIINNRRTYLLPWNRYKTCKHYPREFNQIAFKWLLCCKRLKVFPKDIVYLIIEYIAEMWKLS